MDRKLEPKGKVPKVTVALMMCELSSHLASSLCVSIHTLGEAHSVTIDRPAAPAAPDQLLLQNGAGWALRTEAASANALAPNTTHAYTLTYPLTLSVSIPSAMFFPIMPPAPSLPPSEWF